MKVGSSSVDLLNFGYVVTSCCLRPILIAVAASKHLLILVIPFLG